MYTFQILHLLFVGGLRPFLGVNKISQVLNRWNMPNGPAGLIGSNVGFFFPIGTVSLTLPGVPGQIPEVVYPDTIPFSAAEKTI